MDFYFCGKYIYTDCDDKEVERSMFVVVPYFRGAYDCYGYEDWEMNLEAFFQSFWSDIWAKVPLWPNEVGEEHIIE